VKEFLIDKEQSEYDFLREFLNGPDVEERESCHEKFVASFALKRALSRIESTRKYEKKHLALRS